MKAIALASSSLIEQINQEHYELGMLTFRALEKAEKIGRMLIELQNCLPEGQWERTVEEEFPFSLRVAYRYKQIAKNAGRIKDLCGEHLPEIGLMSAVDLLRANQRLAPLPENQKIVGGDFRRKYPVGATIRVTNPLNRHYNESAVIVRRSGVLYFAVSNGVEFPLLAGEMEIEEAIEDAIRPVARRTSSFYRKEIKAVLERWGEILPKKVLENLEAILDGHSI